MGSYVNGWRRGWECDAEHWLVGWLAVAWLGLVGLLIYAKPLQLFLASELDPGSIAG